MLLHLTRVDDVMCFNHLSFLFLVHWQYMWVKSEIYCLALEILTNQGNIVLMETLIILSLSNKINRDNLACVAGGIVGARNKKSWRRSR